MNPFLFLFRPGSRGKGRDLVVYGAVICLFLVYYRWQSTHDPDFGAPNKSAYGALAEAFLQGQVSLLIQPGPQWDNLADPYKPSNREGLVYNWDVSYYKAPHQDQGKFYLYFGPAPALLIYCPFKLLFGYMPSNGLAFLIVCLANLILFAVLLRVLVRYYFPETSLGFQVVLLVMYGLCNLFPYLMCTPYKYQMAIGFAATATLACFLFLLLALAANTRKGLWLGLAGVSAGVAFASRPLDISLGIVLLVMWWHLVRKEAFPAQIFRPSFWGKTSALFGPALFCALAVAWYNEVRFGNPFEFGIHYQLTDGDPRQLPPMSIAYVVNCLWSYFLSPWHPVARFPFIDPDPGIDLPGNWLRPKMDTHIGLLTVCPILLLSLAWPFYCRGKSGKDASIGVFALMLSGWVIVITCLLAMWPTVSFRYETEVQMPLLLLTTLTLLLSRQGKHPPRWQMAVQAILIAFSCYQGFALGLIGNARWIFSQ